MKRHLQDVGSAIADHNGKWNPCFVRWSAIADPTSLKTDQHHREGVVLIVVLVLVMMVALAGFGFLSAMSTEYEAAKINGQLIQAQQTLASAETMLLWITEQSKQQPETVDGLLKQPEFFRGRSIQSNAEGEQIAEMSEAAISSANSWRFSVIHPVTRRASSKLQFGLQDESARLHLAMVLGWEQAEAGTGRAALMQLPGMSESIADAMLDWIDADDQAREFGAESDYYQRLDKPYKPRNGIPETVDELLFVKGVTRELLHGMTAGTGDEFGISESESVTDWTQLLTCTSAESNLTSAGNSKINLNSTDLEKLHQALSAQFDESLVRYIILARQYGVSFADENSSTSTASGSTGEIGFSLSKESQFSIASPALLIDSYVEVPSGRTKQRIPSPLQSNSPDFMEMVDLLYSQTTTIPDEIIVGRININLASETVLRAIPEMSTETASQIVQQRDSLEESERGNSAWLLSHQVVTAEQYRKWFPYITTGGDVFTGEIVVFRKTGGPFLRRKLTIDASKRSTSVVDWIDLTDQGLPAALSLLSQSEAGESQFSETN